MTDSKTNKLTKINAVRGMNDLLPADAQAWQHLDHVLQDLTRAYGYEYLRTPIVEMTAVFQRGVGEATDIVEKEMQYIDPRNRGYISWANQILFEANRQLKNHFVSSQICLKMLVIGGYEEDLFSDKWRLSCSMEFLKETMIRKSNQSIDDFKQSLFIWSNSPVVKRDSKNMVLGASYISLAMRNLNDKNAISYLEESIGHTKSGNEFIAKAYLILALMKYEFGKKEESLSIIRFISGKLDAIVMLLTLLFTNSSEIRSAIF